MASPARHPQWSEIVNFLQTSVERMVRDKQVLQSATAKVFPRDVAQMMVATFYEAVEAPREQYVHQLIDRLSAIQAERDNTESQSVELEATCQMDFGRASRQNDDIRSEIDSLETELRALERRHARKEKVCQDRLAVKTSELEELSQFLSLAQESQQQLQRHVSEVRSSVNKMKRGQLHLLRQARTILSNQIDEALDHVSARQKQVQSRKIGKISAALSEIQAEQLRLEDESKSLLDCIADTVGNSRLRLITAEQIPQKLGDIRAAIAAAIEARREKAADQLKQDVAKQFPGIDFGEMTVCEAIRKYTLERIRAKKLECQQILRKEELREKKLKEKLDEALRKIRKLQKGSQQSFQSLDELERSKREWEEQQRKLDAKMSALTAQHHSSD
jgi:hypothetical protein